MNIIAEELAKRFEEVPAMEFYREVFPEGELDGADELTPGRYAGIAVAPVMVPHIKPSAAASLAAVASPFQLPVFFLCFSAAFAPPTAAPIAPPITAPFNAPAAIQPTSPVPPVATVTTAAAAIRFRFPQSLCS